MSQPRGTLEVRKCGLCKRGGGFTKVCNPLSYNTNARVKKLTGSNPFINTDGVKTKCIRVTSPCLKRKRKWPMMRGNSSQTSDIISKDKTTQFPDDLVHNIQKIEVVEYEVTKETGEKEVIVTKTESLTRFISSKNNDSKDLHKTESITKFDGTGKEISKELVTLYEPNPSFNNSAGKTESANQNYGSSENVQVRAKYTKETTADSQLKKTESETTFREPGREITKRNRNATLTTYGDTERKPKVSLSGPIVQKRVERRKLGSSIRPGKSIDSVRSIILRNLNKNIPRSGGGKIESSMIVAQNKFSVKANIMPKYKCCRRPPTKRKSIQSSQVEVLETITPLIPPSYECLTSDQQKRAHRRISTNVRAGLVCNDRSTIHPAKSRNSARDTAQINSSKNITIKQLVRKALHLESAKGNNDPLTIYRKERKTSGHSPLDGTDISATNQSRKRSSENAPTPMASGRTSNNDPVTEQSRRGTAENTAANMKSSYTSLTEGTKRRSSERSPPKVESHVASDENARASRRASKNSQQTNFASNENPRASTESRRASKNSQQTNFASNENPRASTEGRRVSNNSQTKAELSQSQSDSPRTAVSKKGTTPNIAENTASSNDYLIEKAKNTVTKSPPKMESQVVSDENSKIDKDSKRTSVNSPRKSEPTDIPNTASINVEDQQRTSKSNSQRNSKDMAKQEQPLAETQQSNQLNDTAEPAPAVIKTRVYTEIKEVTNDEAGNVLQTVYKVESESDTEIIEPPIHKEEPEEEPEEKPKEKPKVIKPIPKKCNNCCRGSPCSNSCGCRCPCYYPMCCMHACNNCMTYPARPKCNGACCSRNCGASSNCCHSRNH